MIIAIDGPAGSGKSSLARELASKLGFVHLDTGALYRCVALAALQQGVDLDDASQVTQVAQGLDIRFVPITHQVTETESSCAEISFEGETPLLSTQDSRPLSNSSAQRVYLNGTEVTSDIRQPRIDSLVSRVASIQGVRDALLSLQRSYGASSSLVVEGRDVSTVVFPDATVKLFLTASPEARALRRFVQTYGKAPENDADPAFVELLDALIKRDHLDSHRDIAPLKPADDAIVVDTSNLSFDQVLDQVLSCVSQYV